MSDLITKFIEDLIILVKKNGGVISIEKLTYLKDYSQTTRETTAFD